MLFVQLLRALGERAGTEPVTVALGDDRRLEGDVGDRKGVVESLGQFERTLDVLSCRFEVALTA